MTTLYEETNIGINRTINDALKNEFKDRLHFIVKKMVPYEEIEVEVCQYVINQFKDNPQKLAQYYKEIEVLKDSQHDYYTNIYLNEFIRFMMIKANDLD
jgi:hypothetical protein